jgi:hypothetical protein
MAASLDGSQLGWDSNESEVTAGSGPLGLASEPDEIVHSPSDQSWSPADLERPAATPDPDLVAPYTPTNWHPSGITHFKFEVVIFQAMQTLSLPNNKDALELFFLMLHENDFHFYFSSEEDEIPLGRGDRTIPYSDCYRLYLNFPYSTLRALYCQGCPIHPISLPGQTRSREEMADAVKSFVQAGIDIVRGAQAGGI